MSVEQCIVLLKPKTSTALLKMSVRRFLIIDLSLHLFLEPGMRFNDSFWNDFPSFSSGSIFEKQIKIEFEQQLDHKYVCYIVYGIDFIICDPLEHPAPSSRSPSSWTRTGASSRGRSRPRPRWTAGRAGTAGTTRAARREAAPSNREYLLSPDWRHYIA